MTKCQSLRTGILFVGNASFLYRVFPDLIGNQTPKKTGAFCVTKNI